VSFFLIQSLEVSIEVKRRTSDNYLPLQRTNWNVQRDQPAKETDKRPAEYGIPKATKKDIIKPINKQSSNEGISTLKKSQNEIMLMTANYERYPPGAKLKGPGAGGEGVTVPASRKDDEDEGFDQHSFNRVASDLISMHRTLRDHRHKG